jgi:hypothetical protein
VKTSTPAPTPTQPKVDTKVNTTDPKDTKKEGSGQESSPKPKVEIKPQIKGGGR